MFYLVLLRFSLRDSLNVNIVAWTAGSGRIDAETTRSILRIFLVASPKLFAPFVRHHLSSLFGWVGQFGSKWHLIRVRVTVRLGDPNSRRHWLHVGNGRTGWKRRWINEFRCWKINAAQQINLSPNPTQSLPWLTFSGTALGRGCDKLKKLDILTNKLTKNWSKLRKNS